MFCFVFFTPRSARMATGSTGLWFKAAAGGTGNEDFKTAPFVSLTLRPQTLMGDGAPALGSIRQNGTSVLRDALCPQHLGPGGGVLCSRLRSHRPRKDRIRGLAGRHQ